MTNQFYTFSDGTVVRLSSIDMVGKVMLAADYFGSPNLFSAGTYCYRIITFGFSGGMGYMQPTMRYNSDKDTLEAERSDLIAAMTV